MRGLRNSGSLVDQVFQREAGVRKQSRVREKKRTYQHIVPNSTITNVATPTCHMKRFTPDGSKLICFSASAQSVEVFKFNGIVQPAEALKASGEVWQTYFTHLYTTCTLGWLCRDFCLVTDCGNYMILAGLQKGTTGAVGDANPSSLPFFTSEISRDSCFYVVRLQDGAVVDEIRFEDDFIPLAHHGGVYLCGNRFVILSIKHQTVHVYHLSAEGKLLKMHAVGWHCAEDDNMYLEMAEASEALFLSQEEAEDAQTTQHCVTGLAVFGPSDPAPVAASLRRSASGSSLTRSLSGLLSKIAPEEGFLPASHEVLKRKPVSVVSGIRQRLLTFLYRRFQCSPDSRRDLRRFYANFDQYASLAMERMQLLDERRLLLRFSSPNDVMMRLTHNSDESFKAFYVVYDFVSTEVLEVVDNSPENMETLYRTYCQYVGSCESRRLENECIHDFWQSRPSGTSWPQAAKTFLQHLPFTPQTWNSSPYFDSSLFDYDEKVIGAVDRPRPCTEYPIKFYCKETNELKFKIIPGKPDELHTRSFKLATYLFHPTLPFIASVQQTPPAGSEVEPSWVVNFHVRVGKGVVV